MITVWVWGRMRTPFTERLRCKSKESPLLIYPPPTHSFRTPPVSPLSAESLPLKLRFVYVYYIWTTMLFYQYGRSGEREGWAACHVGES